MHALPYPPLAPGADAVYVIDETMDLTDVRPMIAKPFSPGAFPAEDVARERITFDKALIGSCTNGSYDDLLQAALVMRAARDRGVRTVERELAIFRAPAASRARSKRRNPGWPASRSRRCSVGGKSVSPGAAPASARDPTRSRRDNRVTSFNRNWQNRMGVGGEGYLASPPSSPRRR